MLAELFVKWNFIVAFTRMFSFVSCYIIMCCLSVAEKQDYSFALKWRENSIEIELVIIWFLLDIFVWKQFPRLNLELPPEACFQGSDESITVSYWYWNAHKDYNPWSKWLALISRSKWTFFLSNILSHHQYIVSNVNSLSLIYMKYCLYFSDHLFKTGSRRLKLMNVYTHEAWCFTFQNL